MQIAALMRHCAFFAISQAMWQGIVQPRKVTPGCAGTVKGLVILLQIARTRKPVTTVANLGTLQRTVRTVLCVICAIKWATLHAVVIQACQQAVLRPPHP